MPDDVWQLTRKTLQRKLPVEDQEPRSGCGAAKYLRVVECKSTHGAGVPGTRDVDSLLWV
jgi:hypothetical protein